MKPFHDPPQLPTTRSPVSSQLESPEPLATTVREGEAAFDRLTPVPCATTVDPGEARRGKSVASATTVRLEGAGQGDPVAGATTVMAFDRSLCLERLGDDRFQGDIGAEWHVVRGPHGGYLAALLLAAMTQRVAEPARRVRVLTAHYPKVPKQGPVEVQTRVLRVGRSMTWLSAALVQDDAVCVQAQAAFSTPWKGLEYGPILPPAALTSSPEQGLPAVPGMPRFTQMFHYRSLFGNPLERDAEGRVGGFIRLREPRRYDPCLLAALSDAWFPATFAHHGRPAMAATLDLTVHFREHQAVEALDASAFLLGVFRSKLAAEGFFEEDGELWSREGRLLAQSRQLAIATPIG